MDVMISTGPIRLLLFGYSTSTEAITTTKIRFVWVSG